MTLTTDASTDTITFASTGSTEQSAAFKEYLYVATSSQTTFSGSDANSDTLSYTPGFLEVHLNGVKLRDTTDYTATTGSSVVLVNAAGSGDILQINVYRLGQTFLQKELKEVQRVELPHQLLFLN